MKNTSQCKQKREDEKKLLKCREKGYTDENL